MVDFYLVSGRRYLIEELAQRDPIGWNALIAWALGMLASQLIVWEGLSLTTVEGMDAALVAAAIYYGLARVRGTGREKAA